MTAPFKVGILTDNLGLAGRDGIRKAAELGADGVQFYVTRGELDGTQMSLEAIADLRSFVSSLGLEISALCGDLFLGFLNPKTNPEAVRKTKVFLDMANELEVPTVTSHIGKLPEDPNSDAWKCGLEAMHQINGHASKRGVRFASETGAEPAERLAAFLKGLCCNWMGVNFDPANYVINGTDDPLNAFRTLSSFVVHMHAKDAAGPGQEKPVGQGVVPFPELLKEYETAGYSGFLTIEREGGEDRAADVAQAIRYLRALMQKD
jgi:sugar phosphate isomerase/epimerase